MKRIAAVGGGAAAWWSLLTSGCSAGTAAVGMGDCNNSMTCCIKKFPFDPVGACGAVAADIEAAIQAGVLIEGALQSKADEDPDDGWREHCRDN